jgi:glycosyltransferase involved in cell wall biosynthesis
MKKTYQTWKADGITYHCIPEAFPVLHRAWPGFLPVDVWTKYRTNSARIEKIVDGIKPDLVHLFGAENPHYSASILELKDRYPTLIDIQGFGFREPYFPVSSRKSLRLLIENRILQECKNFCGEYESKDVVKVFNRSAKFFPHYYPVNEQLAHDVKSRNGEKKYDLLFVGRMQPQKGILDFLKMVDAVRKKVPHVRAAAVGTIKEYPPAQQLLEKLNLSETVEFLNRFPTQEGLFECYCMSRIFVVPTYNDCYPSTIRESAFLGTPVLAYSTGGIPYSNQNGRENIVLVPTGQWEEMSEKACEILRNPEYQKQLSANLGQLAEEEFALEVNVKRICDAYEAVLKQ